MSLPGGGLHEVTLVDPVRKKVFAAGLWAGSNVKKIATNVCGQRALVLRVTQHGIRPGHGPCGRALILALRGVDLHPEVARVRGMALRVAMFMLCIVLAAIAGAARDADAP